LILFIFLPFIYRYWQALISTPSSFLSFCDKSLLNAMMSEQATRKKQSRICFLLALVMMIVGLSAPSFGKIKVPLYQSSSPLMILLNTNTSMLKTDLPPSRFEQSTMFIDSLLSEISQPVGMIAYTSQAFLVSPMTTDVNTLRHLLKELSPAIMPVQGDSLFSALTLATKRLTPFLAQQPRILIITDSRPTSDDISSAQTLINQGVRIDLVAVGIKELAPFDALTGNGGITIPLNIQLLPRLAFSNLNGKMDSTSQSQEIPRDDGYICVWLALLCWLFAFIRGEIA